MKIRIKGNTLRLRLSQPEVGRLSSEKSVSDSIQFPKNHLTYTLSKSDNSEIEVFFENNKIDVQIPETLIQEWVETQRVGFECTISVKNEAALHILVEKDFKCSADRNEDESDLFDPPT